MSVQITLVVAMAENRAIGYENQLPWRLSADLQHFKAATMGRPMIMGRKTFESIGKPLPGRKTIVVTRQSDWEFDGVLAVGSLEEALEIGAVESERLGVSECMVVGGAEIYRQSIGLANRLLVTEVHADIEGDAFFADFDLVEWRESMRNRFEPDDKNDYPYSFVEYLKK